MQPKTRYAKSGNLHIAYHVVGDGPVDLVFVPGWFSHLEAMLENPEWVRFRDRLASFSRLILFDKRGTGLSDPVPLDKPPTIEERMDDVRAVMDAVGSERAALFGLSEGGPMSMVFAATYPHRTTALILSGTFARGTSSADYPIGYDRATLEKGSKALVDQWGEGLIIQLAAPSIDSPEARELTGRIERQAASPGMALALLMLNLEIDIRGVVPSIRVPTLVVHRKGDMLVPVEHGRWLGAQIPGVRYVELDGKDHVPWVGDVETVVGEVEEFLTGARHAPDLDRVLATVLFTDIVDSTRKATEIGDYRWRELLDHYYAIARRQLAQFRGHEIKTLGDGFLATFDGPARAVRCADAITRAARTLGIEIRAGVHTGECEMMGDDVGGVAVHIGARVSTLAAPSEVLVSSTVKDLVVGSGIEFADRGAHELKGVPGEWRLFAVQN